MNKILGAASAQAVYKIVLAIQCHSPISKTRTIEMLTANNVHKLKIKVGPISVSPCEECSYVFITDLVVIPVSSEWPEHEKQGNAKHEYCDGHPPQS